MLRSTTDDGPAPAAPSSLIVCALLALGVVASLLVTRAIVPATTTHGLLPRWDLAAHLVNGWTPYFHLRNGRVGAFLWDLWSQGYWPPGQSLFQLPFYAVFGGGVAAGLYSSVAAFALTGLCAMLLLGHVAGPRAWLPAAIALGFMITSPFYLAYGSVAMSEMVGAMMQLAVLVAYSHYDRNRSVAATRWFSLSLTLLFFTKYNYFVLLAVPLACHALLDDCRGVATAGRLRTLWQFVRAVSSSVVARVAIVYMMAVVTVIALGGFSLEVAGHRLAFRTVGYALHPLLYGALVHAWHSRRRGRWSWAGLPARLRVVVIWFVVPVTVWLASPHPNHIKDLAYLIVNIPMGQPSARLGLSAYVDALHGDYFAYPVTAAAALIGFITAVVRFRHQDALVRLMILTALLQMAMVTMHHTRDPRFLLLAMPPLWLVSASELGAWLTPRQPATARVLSLAVVMVALVTSDAVTAGGGFRRAAFANYVNSPALADAFAAIRTATRPGDRTAVIGRSDVVSPALVRWQLGPAGGGGRVPDEVARESDLPSVTTAEWVVLIEPSETPMASAQRVVSDLTRAGVLVSSRTYPIADLGVTLRVLRGAACP